MNDVETISELDKIGSKYGCELLLPPFNNSVNPFFKIDEIRERATDFTGFLIELDGLDIDFRFGEVNDKRDYIEILMGANNESI